MDHPSCSIVHFQKVKSVRLDETSKIVKVFKNLFSDPMVLEAMKPWKRKLQNLCNSSSSINHDYKVILINFYFFSKYNHWRNQSSSFIIPNSREQFGKFCNRFNG